MLKFFKEVWKHAPVASNCFIWERCLYLIFLSSIEVLFLLKKILKSWDILWHVGIDLEANKVKIPGALKVHLFNKYLLNPYYMQGLF